MTTVLRERDANTQIPISGPTKSELGKVSQQKKPEQAAPSDSNAAAAPTAGSAHYVSPSDAIMSPASKKLSDFKQRAINGSGRKLGGSGARGSGSSMQRTLFAKALGARAEEGKGGL